MVKVHVNLVCPVSLCGGKVSLLPGANEVDPAAWKAVEKHPVTRALLEDRSIEVEAVKETAAQRRAREKAEEEAREAAEEEAKKKAQGGGSNPEGT